VGAEYLRNGKKACPLKTTGTSKSVAYNGSCADETAKLDNGGTLRCAADQTLTVKVVNKRPPANKIASAIMNAADMRCFDANELKVNMRYGDRGEFGGGESPCYESRTNSVGNMQFNRDPAITMKTCQNGQC